MPPKENLQPHLSNDRHNNNATYSNNNNTTTTTKAAISRPNSSPIALQGIDLSSIEGSFVLSSLPPLPASPAAKAFKDPIKPPFDLTTRFSNKSRERLPTISRGDGRPQTARGGDEDDALRSGGGSSSSSMSKIYHLRKAPGSTPELSLVTSADAVSKSTIDVSTPSNLNRDRPQLPPQSSEDSANNKRKERGFFLGRSKSIRKDSTSSKIKPTGFLAAEAPPKTAPMTTDWPGSEMLKDKAAQQKRGKSSERALPIRQEETASTTPATSSGKAFITGSKNALSKAKTGGGNFLSRIGKIGRSGSSHEREGAPLHPEEHVLRVINLPLVEQTRITRISKSLESCKDKTEYWMPSLPWRCIDYLNLNCESEGLYRIPGSGPQIKQWQKRFDTELDIDLLDETELYDPNNISSLLKLWLRELPTDVFPLEIQHTLAADLEQDNPDYNKMGQPAPQKLRDALSDLSPFNYYLLFAVTCHLSLLVSHQDKNRMDLHNLAICVGPCLRIERWLFNYLIGDWRNCWQGCWTEKRALEDERRVQDPNYVSDVADVPQILEQRSIHEDAISSGGESMVSAPEHIERPPTSSSNRRLASRDNSNTRSTSNTRRPPN